jgi:hypothetical protein
MEIAQCGNAPTLLLSSLKLVVQIIGDEEVTMDTTNKSILLTGASGGIGRRDFLQESNHVNKGKN